MFLWQLAATMDKEQFASGTNMVEKKEYDSHSSFDEHSFQKENNFEKDDWFCGYGCQQNRRNPIYRSTYMDLGWYPPNQHTAPLTHHPTRSTFTRHLSASGMYRNTSLNTAMDPKPLGE